MIATIAEIEQFLQGFKQKVEIFDIIFGMKGARIQMRSQPWISYQTKERKSLKQSRLQIIPRDQ
jgi:hypothetical protein